jgi:hypothetical protein
VLCKVRFVSCKSAATTLLSTGATTAIWEYFQKHEQILPAASISYFSSKPYHSNRKELHFFDTDLFPKFGMAAYERLTAPQREHHTINV